MNSGFSGLDGLNLQFEQPSSGINNDAAADQIPDPQQQPGVAKSRLEEVKLINEARLEAQNEQEAAREKHRIRLERWVGNPVKNHIRVLLCTLPDVLWEGHGIERVGIDKLMDPKAVRTAYRKYIARFAPDKIMAS